MHSLHLALIAPRKLTWFSFRPGSQLAMLERAIGGYEFRPTWIDRARGIAKRGAKRE